MSSIAKKHKKPFWAAYVFLFGRGGEDSNPSLRSDGGFAFPPQTDGSWLTDGKVWNIDTFVSKPTHVNGGTLGAPAIKQVRQLYSPTASDIHFVRDVSFGRDMRYARWKKEANRISL